MKYLVKEVQYSDGSKRFSVGTRKGTLWGCDSKVEARIDANVLELKHLQAQMDKCLETLGEISPYVDPADWLA